ncbi:MAG TPA: hypothetical protein VF020_05465, partial [Chthoniobacterales bacterium]
MVQESAGCLPKCRCPPSTATRADYNQISIAFFQNVNKVLSGEESAHEAVQQVEKVAKRVIR